MAYIIYVVVKLACYIAWCWLGLRLWRPESATLWHAVPFGILRLLIGVVAGVCIFFLVPAHPYDLLSKYLAIYTPVRMLEWLILAMIILRKSDIPISKSLWWCVGGIIVSFAADLAS